MGAFSFFVSCFLGVEELLATWRCSILRGALTDAVEGDIDAVMLRISSLRGSLPGAEDDDREGATGCALEGAGEPDREGGWAIALIKPAEEVAVDAFGNALEGAGEPDREGGWAIALINPVEEVVVDAFECV